DAMAACAWCRARSIVGRSVCSTPDAGADKGDPSRIAVEVSEPLEAAWVPNQGGACTTASVLAGLGSLGARGLPALGPATLALGAREPFGAPALMDYVSLPGRRAPLDVRLEALA